MLYIKLASANTESAATKVAADAWMQDAKNSMSADLSAAKEDKSAAAANAATVEGIRLALDKKVKDLEKAIAKAKAAEDSFNAKLSAIRAAAASVAG